jgi:hypothetical protein
MSRLTVASIVNHLVGAFGSYSFGMSKDGRLVMAKALASQIRYGAFACSTPDTLAYEASDFFGWDEENKADFAKMVGEEVAKFPGHFATQWFQNHVVW